MNPHTEQPVSSSWEAVVAGIVITAVVVVGLPAFLLGEYKQARKDECEVSQAFNVLGLNSANVVRYC